MKINKMGSASPPLKPEREGGVKAEESGGAFALNLARSQDQHSRQRLNELLDAIGEQGKRLSATPTYAELKTYRELVREFLSEAVGRMYALQSQLGWDRQGRQKIYTTIRQIDEHLAALAEDVRGGQERQLAILGRLDAIRGLLVDLYM
ncbi:YaaR family protein [Sporolituus thermophilus]|uniref:DUF327 domain-containing protein n=1 Tax=Sporolituus thermophilus DSM 23256 TaxID=1123285 RepID=A0A1G7HN75_9FIRM|nr:YaaR family protein [Sporolituus thermophilus]SDF01664.1 hypothetical protein SAMN05660235_00152 [Sporolituus thermophilus DSM 23256]